VTPTVSVVIAAYNAEAFIGEAVASALAQTFDDLEVIVVDDGSTDGTANGVAEFADDRLRLVRSDNRGPSAARNIAIEAGDAPWIAVLDADDFWGPRRLEMLLEANDASAADMLIDDIVIVDGRDPATSLFQEIGLVLAAPAPLNGLGFVAGRIGGRFTERPGIIKPMIRREFLRDVALRYDEEIRYSEDWLLYCQCLLRGARAILVPARTYYYRQQAGSLSFGDVPTMFANQERIHSRLSSEPLLPAQLRPVLDRQFRRNEMRLAAWELAAAVRGRRWVDTLRLTLREPAACRLLLTRAAQRVRSSASRRARSGGKRVATRLSLKRTRSKGSAG
jgi:succinoglycan biosynthesis protein ExoO